MSWKRRQDSNAYDKTVNHSYKKAQLKSWTFL